ncbi:MAG: hypothetical protein WAL63_13255 [Solirubrobacteraceae bacterium]
MRRAVFPGAVGLVALLVGAGLAACGTSYHARQSQAQALFVSSCGTCHSLSGRASARQQGGDLLDLQIGRSAMLQFVREMPTRGRLSSPQELELAEYVLALERGRH